MTDTGAMRFRIFLLCALACSCHRQPPSAEEHRITDAKQLAELRAAFVPEAYIRPEDQKKAERLRDGYSGPFPCSYDKIEEGTHVIASLPTDQCFKMSKPQTWRGLWRNEYEGSLFCLAPARACPRSTPADRIWLTLPKPVDQNLEGRGGLYDLEFLGRRTLYKGGFGSYGMFNYELIADRMISIKEIEAPPAADMDDQVLQWMIAEEAKGIFIPSAVSGKRMRKYVDAMRRQQER